MKKKCLRRGLLSVAIATAMSVTSVYIQADIIIGVAGPHTGPNAAFGEQLWKGAEKAAADLNRAGGLTENKLNW